MKKKRAEKKAAMNKLTPLEPESSDVSDEDEEVISGILVSESDSEDDTPLILPLRRSTSTTHTTYATRQFYGHF